MIQLNLHVLYVAHGVIEPTALWVLKEEREIRWHCEVRPGSFSKLRLQKLPAP